MDPTGNPEGVDEVTKKLQDTFDAILSKYNSAIEPLESWLSMDIVALINVLDAELQQRAYTHDQRE